MSAGEAWFVSIVLFGTMLLALAAAEMLARLLEPATRIGGS